MNFRKSYQVYLNMLIDMKDQPDLEKLSYDLINKAQFDLTVTAAEFYSLARTRVDMLLQKVRENG